MAGAAARHGLPLERLVALVDARAGDLDAAPPADLAALEAYGEATAGRLALLAADVLGVAEAGPRGAARAVAVAGALVGALRNLPSELRRRRLNLPVATLEECGTSISDVMEMRPDEGLKRTARRVAETAARRLAEAGRAGGGPAARRAARPLLLQAAVTRGHIAALRRAGWDPLSPRLLRRPPGMAWRVTVAAALGRY